MQSACSSSAAPCDRMSTASGCASDRRPSYFKACMTSRRLPSYSPTARDLSTISSRPWHDGQESARASGSPHLSQMGGVIGRMEPQQCLHTQPDSGSSRTALQTAHGGASNAAIRPFAASLTYFPGLRDLGLGPSEITGSLQRRDQAVEHLTYRLNQIHALDE